VTARELVGGHGREQQLVGGDRARQLGMTAEPAVEVGAHADRDGAAQPQQRVDEPLP
jgi:hypothetical protein